VFKCDRNCMAVTKTISSYSASENVNGTVNVTRCTENKTRTGLICAVRYVAFTSHALTKLLSFVANFD